MLPKIPDAERLPASKVPQFYRHDRNRGRKQPHDRKLPVNLNKNR
jgi:hypothetical protein